MSFQANAVSLKLLSFQAWFIRKVTGEGLRGEVELLCASESCSALKAVLVGVPWRSETHQVARPTGQAPQDILKRYNRTKGVPPVALVRRGRVQRSVVVMFSGKWVLDSA